jgi:hypothetical protein
MMKRATFLLVFALASSDAIANPSAQDIVGAFSDICLSKAPAFEGIENIADLRKWVDMKPVTITAIVPNDAYITENKQWFHRTQSISGYMIGLTRFKSKEKEKSICSISGPYSKGSEVISIIENRLDMKKLSGDVIKLGERHMLWSFFVQNEVAIIHTIDSRDSSETGIILTITTSKEAR